METALLLVICLPLSNASARGSNHSRADVLGHHPPGIFASLTSLRHDELPKALQLLVLGPKIASVLESLEHRAEGRVQLLKLSQG